jgi:LysM repeat protein
MPAATIGLFALAIAIVALAFLIQRTLSDGDDGGPSQAQINETQVAIWTQTAAAGGGGDRTPEPTSETPGTGETPSASETAGAGETPTPGDDATPGGSGTTYTVQSGDFCGTIAEEFGITVEELIAANDLDADCTIFPDQELIIP